MTSLLLKYSFWNFGNLGFQLMEQILFSYRAQTNVKSFWKRYKTTNKMKFTYFIIFFVFLRSIFSISPIFFSLCRSPWTNQEVMNIFWSTFHVGNSFSILDFFHSFLRRQLTVTDLKLKPKNWCIKLNKLEKAKHLENVDLDVNILRLKTCIAEWWNGYD